MAAKYHEWLTDEGLSSLSQLAAQGMNTAQIAEKIGVSEKTFSEWVVRFPMIRQAINGEEYADKQVENALLKRALGYRHTEVTQQLSKEGEMEVVKIVEKEVMPSTTAQIFWLKNRCGYIWDGAPQDGEEDEEGGVVVLPSVGGTEEQKGD